jgi:hypothetical protein
MNGPFRAGDFIMAISPRPFGLGWLNRPFGPYVRAAWVIGVHTGNRILNGPFRAGELGELYGHDVSQALRPGLVEPALRAGCLGDGFQVQG